MVDVQSHVWEMERKSEMHHRWYEMIWCNSDVQETHNNDERHTLNRFDPRWWCWKCAHIQRIFIVSLRCVQSQSSSLMKMKMKSNSTMSSGNTLLMPFLFHRIIIHYFFIFFIYRCASYFWFYKILLLPHLPPQYLLDSLECYYKILFSNIFLLALLLSLPSFVLFSFYRCFMAWHFSIGSFDGCWSSIYINKWNRPKEKKKPHELVKNDIYWK